MVEQAYSERVHRQLDISLAPNRITLLKARYDLLLADGFIDAPIDFDRFIDPGPLAVAMAERGSREQHVA